MKKIILITVFLIGARYAWRHHSGWEGASQYPIAANKVFQASGCKGKEYCVVIVAAEWCPHCKSMNEEWVPVFREVLRQDFPNTGFTTILGQSSLEKSAAYGRSYKMSYVYDDGDAMKREMGVFGVPSLAVLRRTDQRGIMIGSHLKMSGSSKHNAVHNLFTEQLYLTPGATAKPVAH